MLDRAETEFLGLRGLHNHALHEGDRDTARRLAERAAALRPDARWAMAAGSISKCATVAGRRRATPSPRPSGGKSRRPRPGTIAA